MFCPDCGLETTEGSRFCKRCGQRLSHGSSPIHEELLHAVESTGGQAEDCATGVAHRIEQLLQDAIRCQADGRYQEALMICEAIIDVDKTNTSAHSMMAIIYERTGRIAMAIEQLRIVTQLNPGSIADQIKLDELQQQIGINRPASGLSAPLVVNSGVKKPVNPLFLAVASAAAVFILGTVVLNNTSNKTPSSQPANQTNGNNLVPNTTNGIGIPQAPPSTSANGQLPGNNSVIQPYVAGGTAPAPAQQPNPILQAPQPQSYQQRPSGNSGGAGLASIPSLPPITGLSTEKVTPQASSSSQNEPSEPKTPVQTPENNAPTGIYEITVNSGASVRPKQAQTGSNESDTLLRIAQDKAAKGDYRGAIDSYTAAQNFGANSAGISNSIAQNHRRLNNIQDARRAYQDALKKANDAISRGTNVAQATRDKEIAEQGLKACGD